MNRTLVIVVTFNGRKWMDGCLGSLRRSARKADVLVVDNASTDGTAEYVREHFPECRLLACQDNLGFGQANNIGLELAVREGYDYVYLLNQDAWVLPDTIGRLEDACRAAKGTAGPGERTPGAGPGILSPVQKAASGRLDANFKDKCGGFLDKGGELVEVPFVMAAHWFMPTSVIRKVGGFSPAFSMYGEDDNYIDRLHMHGMKCMVLKSATGIHDREGRSESRERKMKLKCTGALRRMIDPHRSWGLALALMPLELAATGMKNLSTVPLACMRELWGRRRQLRALREESLKDGAFLDIQP